jgi:sulfite reductase (ferredoxin)
MRLTVEQNIVLRWVPAAALPEVYEGLGAIGLGEPGAGTISDITACPGTDTCKLGISSSRGLASEIRRRLDSSSDTSADPARDLRIKISGCFNSCGQHHAADLGFYGISRTRENRKVPHFQVVLGGSWGDNAGTFGLAIGAVPSRRVPETVERIRERYVDERKRGEKFQEYVRRVGKTHLRKMLDDLMAVPPYQEDRSYFADWGDPREFTLGDMGVGECAGEVVAFGESDDLAYRAMLEAVKGLLRSDLLDVPQDERTLVREFRSRFYDTELFHDKYAGGKFAEYLFRRSSAPLAVHTDDTVRRLIEEAQLFIEASHACRDRIVERAVPAATPPSKTQEGQAEAAQ